MYTRFEAGGNSMSDGLDFHDGLPAEWYGKYLVVFLFLF